MKRFLASIGILLSLAAQPALACGGFFCQTVPVDQAGERIVFSVDGDKVTAIIQVQYTGDARQFAWIVPVPAQPTVGVGSDEIFVRLNSVTKPFYQLNTSLAGTCKTSSPGGFLGLFGGATATAVMDSAAAPKVGGNAVTVVSQESIGPYESAVLTSTDPDALKTWLTTNGYNIPAAAGDLIAPYVQAHSYFVALKLRKDKSTGDLQPVVLKLTEPNPCIPIRLTAIAATPNMPLTIWIFGKGRAIPRNYRHVRLNDALIDWYGAGNVFTANSGNVGIATPLLAPATLPVAPGSSGTTLGYGPPPAPNYDAVVTQSMAEAGGQGWVTEYASASAAVSAVLNGTYDTTALKAVADPFAFMQAVQARNFPTSGPIQGIIRKYLPAPAGFSEQLYWNLFQTSPATPLTSQEIAAAYPQFDPVHFADDLDNAFNKPLADLRDLVTSAPYLTRVYTTMSPAQMTKDPIFSFHPGLADVSNIHKADAITQCSSVVYEYEAPIKIVLANGQHFTIKGNRQPLGLGSAPAALSIEQLFEDQNAQQVLDNLAAITAALAKVAPDVVGPGCACSNPAKAAHRGDSGPADREAAFWSTCLAGVVAWRRRKKR